MTRTARLGLKLWGPMIVLIIVACFLIWQFVPRPLPTTITLATGSPDGHYTIFGRALRERMAERGVSVKLVRTKGSADNIRLLLAGEVDLALVQSGGLAKEEAATLRTICSLFREPCFLFRRKDVADDAVDGLRLAIGEQGSGTRQLIGRLLEDAGIRPGDGRGTRVLDLGGPAAVKALLAGEADIAAFVTAPDVPWLRPLFESPDIRLRPFERATAMTHHYRFLNELVIPAGLIDLIEGLPAEDAVVVATTASLVGQADIHAGLIPLLIESCRDELADGALLSAPDEFPSVHGVDAPVHRDAADYFRHGPSLFQRLLPGTLGNTIARLSILLVPLLTLLFPLLKGAGPLFRWIVQRRVFRWYRVLRALEAAMDASDDAESRAAVREELERVGEEIRHTHVPSRYAADLFHLRTHHRMLIDRLDSE